MTETATDRVHIAVPRVSRFVPAALIALIVVAALLPILSIRRMPTPFADVQLYASIARARQLYGVGVPTISWNSPVAVDHIPFYGPVFFDLAALALRVFGMSLWSFRIVSLAGTIVYVLATVLLARQFTGSTNRMLLAALLTLASPEVNFGAATGAMHMLAVGLQVLALAAFVADFDGRTGGAEYGVTAGVCLALAALTTPRSYPFVFAFMCAGGVPLLFGGSRMPIVHRVSAAALTCIGIMGAWMVISHGSPAAWVRYMGHIATHEDTDVALLPTAERTFSFHLSGIITPAFAASSGLLAAWSLHRLRSVPAARHEADREAARTGALSFLLACAWIDLILNAVVLNYTFTIVEYIALPLFSVVVSWPWTRMRDAVPRRLVAASMCVVLGLDCLHIVYRYVSVAPEWRAHDPSFINAFVARYVPPGSTVVGPNEPFFFPVERSGSRYRVMSPRSWADWARWVPAIEPEAAAVARRFAVQPAGERFVLWPEDEELPSTYRCAAASRVATFDAPPLDARWPAWVRARAKSHPDPGYPSAVLYRLPDGCPAGYDPTRPPAPSH